MFKKTNSFKFGIACAALVIALFCSPTKASASGILFYDDFTFSQNTWMQAINGLGLGGSTTVVTDDASYAAALAGGGWSLVITQFDCCSHGTSADLATYVGGGGSAIFSHWLTDDDATFGISQQNVNLNTLTISDGGLSAGLSSSIQLLNNPTYGIYSRSFTAGGGVIAATFEDGNGGIAFTNGGRTIVNGFLGETLNNSDEVRLYQNEIQRQLGLTTVPEPSTLLLLSIGVIAVALHNRKKQAAQL